MAKLFLGFLACTIYLFSEPSAFSAGDLSIQDPYGLTPNEKLLLKNIDSVKHLKRDKNVINSDVDQLKNNLDGLRSVMDGLALSQQKTQNLLKKMLQTEDDLEVASLEHKNSLFSLDSNVSALVDLQNKNYEKIQESFSSFDKRLKRIEENYVSKKTFDALQVELTQFRELVATEFKKLNKGCSSSLHSKEKSLETLYQEGKKALKAKEYKTAASRFAQTIVKNHHPAASHFYSGEAFYYQKEYKKAVRYYKESYRRYKKGSYNAKLFLHMGISLDKLGKKSKAAKIFKTVIKKYPGTHYARTAKKYL